MLQKIPSPGGVTTVIDTPHYLQWQRSTSTSLLLQYPQRECFQQQVM